MESRIFKNIYNLISKKYPNRKIFIISDHHFFHNRIIEMVRKNFSTIEEMNEYIINKHNEVVGVDDIVIFLGDFSFNYAKIPEINNRLNGIKFLVMGNHDNTKIIKNYDSLGFENVYIFPVKLNDDFLSHYPLASEEITSFDSEVKYCEFNKQSNGINYHGHIHINKKENCSSGTLNVSCEQLDYKPIFWGYTANDGSFENTSNILLDSQDFESIIKEVAYKKSCTKEHVLKDYLFASFLSSINKFQSKYYVYGSYGFYRKYNYMSSFGDLDISFLFDSKVSTSENYKIFKTMGNEITNYINSRNITQSEFYARYNNIYIVICHYLNGLGQNITAPVDMNCISIPFYEPTDYFLISGNSLIEHTIPSLLEKYNLPKFDSFFYTHNVELANLLLQLFFQNCDREKSISILKKIKFLSKKTDILDFSVLEDIIIRYFLKNIYFLCTRSRCNEFKNIIHFDANINNYISELNSELIEFIKLIFQNKDSNFNECFKNIFSNESKKYISSACMVMMKDRKWK